MREGTGKGARQTALYVLNRVDAGAFADIALDGSLDGLAQRDRALATEIVYGVLRWRIHLDWVIDAFSSVKTRRLERAVANALRVGLYQLYFLTRVPPSAAIDSTVELVKAGGRKKAGFVNAVLRAAASGRDAVPWPDVREDPAGHVSAVYSHPEWMVRRWLARFGLDETIELCKVNLRPPPRTLRVNTLVTSREALCRDLVEAGFEARPAASSPDGVEITGGAGPLGPKDPRYYIQDEASQVIAYLLSPGPGETVCDACAAPGGKTTHLAQLMRDTGAIYAFDRDRGRLETLKETAKRLGVRIVRTFALDASLPLPPEAAPPAGFDAILCDAPCSGLGVLRRTPDIKLRITEEDIKELSLRQTRLLDNLSGYLGRGGRMVYSVCSFEPEETEAVVEGFLEGHGGFALENAGGCVPEECRVWAGSAGFLRTYPHRHGVDGFFAARLRKRD
jgi:16S rRNA (cytosine967-C5)-methyltransferase